MADDEDFWDDLLAHLRQKVLVPITGPDLSIVADGNTVRSLSEIVARRLHARYGLDFSNGETSMSRTVATVIRRHGRDEADRLYRIINDIYAEFDDSSCPPLRELATIDDFRVFVSTTPDRLLVQAINEARFRGNQAVREYTFSPNQSTADQARNLRPPHDTDTVAVRLFGQAASTPQFAIHDEDLLEWLHYLASAGSLPEWFTLTLKEHPLLFIGCDIPDWLGRFLIRLASHTRLWLDSKQFFFVGSSTDESGTALSNFFSTYCRKSQVQQLDMNSADFVSELHSRWAHTTSSARRRPNAPASGNPSPSPTIFISYTRDDFDFAEQLCDEITELGGDVWLDERRLRPGDEWETQILRSIRRTVRLFLPIISARTEGQEEGYVFREWREAIDRSYSIPRRRFIVPIIVDPSRRDIAAYQQVPDEFRRFNFGHAPAGRIGPELRTLLIDEIRSMRRSGVA